MKARNVGTGWPVAQVRILARARERGVRTPRPSQAAACVWLNSALMVKWLKGVRRLSFTVCSGEVAAEDVPPNWFWPAPRGAS